MGTLHATPSLLCSDNMSSLAAARADNFYFPPEWTPSRGGLNKFNKSHGALGKRANKLASHGILVVRFEMMYNAWCLGCKRPIGRGTRYNADKKRVGNYFSTPVYEFAMKCATCPQRFVIRTDPQHRDYEFVSGIRRKVEGYTVETARDSGARVVDGSAERAARTANALAVVEHSTVGERRARSAAARLDATIALAHARSRDAPGLNKVLRARARAHRKQARDLQREAASRGLGIQLLPRAAEDSDQAKRAGVAARRKRPRSVLDTTGASADSDTRHVVRRVARQSIFGGSTARTPPGAAALRTRAQARRPATVGARGKGAVLRSVERVVIGDHTTTQQQRDPPRVVVPQPKHARTRARARPRVSVTRAVA